MRSFLAETIRAERTRRGLTQEQLAQVLNVSPQAVSKWENGLTLPDLSLIPALCRALGLSADALLQIDESAQAIDAVKRQAETLIESDPEKARSLLRAGLERHPAAAPLWRTLLYATDYTQHPDETLDIARQLTACTRDESDRFDALRFTAYALSARGDERGALSAAEKLPDLTFSRLSEMAFLLHGEGKRDAAEKQARISFENLLQMLEQAAEYEESIGQKSRADARRQKALRLLELMQDEPYAAELAVYVVFFEKRLKQ